jgi:hypothetical protein
MTGSIPTVVRSFVAIENLLIPGGPRTCIVIDCGIPSAVMATDLAWEIPTETREVPLTFEFKDLRCRKRLGWAGFTLN